MSHVIVLFTTPSHSCQKKVYTVLVQNNNETWQTDKRFSDFKLLEQKVQFKFSTKIALLISKTYWQQLRKKFWYSEVPKHPAKSIFNGSSEATEKRRQSLKEWLESLLVTPTFAQSEEMWSFLASNEQGSPAMI